MTTACIVQARLGSSRLPGKVLQSIGSVTMLEKVILRLKRSAHIDLIIVATTVGHEDDGVAAAALGSGAAVVRGDRFDVLDRFRSVLQLYENIDTVVRVTADCPFVDPGIVDALVSSLQEEGLDFVANRLPPPHTRTYPVGLDIEVCTRSALLTAWSEAKAPHQREHVMPFLYENPNRFAIRIHDLAEDLSGYRWTVDTPEDLEAARALDKLCGMEPYDWLHALDIARRNPWIGEINSSGEQKQVRVVDDRWE
jgi:spore coat polysaccharide biosynthesis protein SpsF